MELAAEVYVFISKRVHEKKKRRRLTGYNTYPADPTRQNALPQRTWCNMMCTVFDPLLFSWVRFFSSEVCSPSGALRSYRV